MNKQLIVTCSLFILGLSACQSQGKKQVGEIKRYYDRCVG